MVPFSSLLSALKTTLKLSSREVRRLIAGTILLGVIAALVEYSFALSIQAFFEKLGVLKFETRMTRFEIPDLKTATIILLFIGIFRSILEGLKIFLARLSQQKFAQEIRLQLISYALKNAGTISSGKIQAMFSEETNRASNSVLNLGTFLIQISLSAVLILITLVKFPAATIIGCGLLLLLYIPLKITERKVKGGGFRLSEEWEKTNFVLSSGIRNHFYLRVVGMVDDEIIRARNSLSKYFLTFRRAFALISFKAAMPSSLGIIVLVILGNFYAGGLLGKNFAFLEFFYLFLRFTQSSAQASTVLSEFVLNSESSRRLEVWKNSFSDTKIDLSGNIKYPKEKWELRFENIGFGYTEKSLFSHVNLCISEGEILVIKGESGSGKSTLLSLILRLLRPNAGNILLNERDIMTYDSGLINRTGYVGPSAFLIEGTIIENLLYGNFNEKPCDDDLWKALKVAELDTYISKFPAKLNTKLSEMGSELSTGQKQRLMIARSLLRNPKLIIMDEATANLDKETEEKIISNLQKIIDKKILIIVTHKSSFDAIANHVFEMKTS